MEGGLLPWIGGAARGRVSDRLATAIRGSAWALCGYGASQLLRVLSTLLLARYLLTPESFGLVALVNVFLMCLDMFSDLGIEMNVIQHPRGDEPRFLNTAYWIQAARGLLLCGIAMALAYPFALFYKQPAVTTLIIVAALSVAVRGFTSGSIWGLKRHVQLRNIALLTASSELGGFAVSVIWALLSPTAWALVARTVVSTLLYLVGSHFVGKQRIHFEWDSEAARSILHFGAGIFVTTATYFLAGQAERLVLGKFMTVAELGCFSLALTIATLPSGAVSQLAGQVFFPMISRSAREDQETAARHFKKARLVFLGISLLLGIGFIAYSHRLVALLLPPKYAMTGWMLQLIGCRAALEVFYAPTSSLIFAYGQPKYCAASNTIRLTLVFGGVWLAVVKFGLLYAVGVLAFAPAAGYLAFLPGIARNARRVLAFEIGCFAVLVSAMTLASLIRWPWA